jgi:murein DD-endopeptidase MepM/ murein hydrolase activator NlpD
LTGFDVEAPAVKYMLHITAENDKNSITEIIYPFYLKKIVQKSGKVFLANEKQALLKPSKQKTEERKTLANILFTDSPQSLWEKTFIYPVEDPLVISPFGKRRLYYINNLFSFIRYHRGIDFKGMRGDPVYSPNNGLVVFAGMRITTGYTLVIDHGHGVFSLFFHLNSIECKQGMFIQKGELIARIGSTGIAEGPHLHWGLFVNGIYVDPADWVKRNF